MKPWERLKITKAEWRKMPYEQRCAAEGHIPMPINDCDDWPSIRAEGASCACPLVGTDARGCGRCGALL